MYLIRANSDQLFNDNGNSESATSWTNSTVLLGFSILNGKYWYYCGFINYNCG